eukprot:48511-Eustigmatos_ZCMA.PRE.1
MRMHQPAMRRVYQYSQRGKMVEGDDLPRSTGSRTAGGRTSCARSSRSSARVARAAEGLPLSSAASANHPAASDTPPGRLRPSAPPAMAARSAP